MEAGVTQVVTYRLFNIGFQFVIDGGVDIKATGEEGFTQLLCELRDNPVDKMLTAMIVGVGIARELHFCRHGLNVVYHILVDPPQSLDVYIPFQHLVEDVLLAFKVIFLARGWIDEAKGRVIGRRVLRHTSQQGSTREPQQWVAMPRGVTLLWIAPGFMARIAVEVVDTRNTFEIPVALRAEVEIVFYSCLDTKVLRTKRGDVEIHLKDFLLGILLSQANGQRGLRNFTIERLLCIICHILDQLLRYGAGATDHATSLHVLATGAKDSLRIDTRICPEGRVLSRGLRIFQDLR